MQKEPVWAGGKVEGAPYTPGIVAGNLIFVSGQVPMNPETKKIVEGDFEAHVKQCLENVNAILEAAGSDLDHAVKLTVFLKDMNHFARLNAVYNTYFGEIKPARTCVEVARLPLDVDVEIEAIAIRKA
jgi:2-iminobutanoate/2-iminopropanoate deaminase